MAFSSRPSACASIAMVALLAAVPACKKDEEHCEELGRDVCESSSHCTARTAFELDGRGEAHERYVACDDSSRVCGASLTCAEERETGDSALFRDTCLPHGWSELPSLQCEAIHIASSDQGAGDTRDSGSALDAGQ